MSKRSLAEVRSRGERLRSSDRTKNSKVPADTNGKAVDPSSHYKPGARYTDRDKFGTFGLTKRQALFVLEYMVDPSSQTDAAVRAGYSPQSAAAQASFLLKQPNVKAAVEDMQERLRERTGITAEAVLIRLSEIAFDTRPKPRSADQVKALELMSKWLGLEVSNSNMQVELVVSFSEDSPRDRLQLQQEIIDVEALDENDADSS